jgi:hypothetical protein
MKTPILLIALIIFFASCENQQNQRTNSDIKVVEGEIFGNKITENNILSSKLLSLQMKNNEPLELKLKGRINAVCQGSGCWLNMDIGNGETVHVTFKNEAFTLPKDITGKTAIIDGIAITEIVSVEMQKRMAQKEGKAQVEIDAITKPLIEYYFEAEGVTLLNDE